VPRAPPALLRGVARPCHARFVQVGRRLLGDCRRFAAALALVWSSHYPNVAAAEPAPSSSSSAPSAAEKDTARALAREGDGLFAERQFEPALARYSAAYHLVRVPTLGVQVAKTQLELGRLAAALRTAREVERMPVQSGEPAVFASARKSAAELAHEIGTRIPRVVVDVTPAEATARVSIDGTPALEATSETGAELDPGIHRLLVGADGYSNVELEFELIERARERLHVTLFPSAGRAVAPNAGGAAAPTSVASVPVTESRSTPAATPVSAPSGESSEDVRRDRAAAARSARTRGYVALGVAGLGIAAGSVTGVLAFTTKPDCPDGPCTPDQKDEIDASKRYGNVATMSFAVGGACLLYGVWELLANGDGGDEAAASSPSELRAGVSPRDGGGLLLEVSSSF
jgi:hypothetical protein